jgi:hypothetical protein|tara:strand:- start:663 stop:1187 length:525 start_codon:yes stop_codon:yes gene_type:complete
MEEEVATQPLSLDGSQRGSPGTKQAYAETLRLLTHGDGVPVFAPPVPLNTRHAHRVRELLTQEYSQVSADGKEHLRAVRHQQSCLLARKVACALLADWRGRANPYEAWVSKLRDVFRQPHYSLTTWLSSTMWKGSYRATGAGAGPPGVATESQVTAIREVRDPHACSICAMCVD